MTVAERMAYDVHDEAFGAADTCAIRHAILEVNPVS